MSSLQHYIRGHHIVSISQQYDNHVSVYAISTTLHSSSPYSFYLSTSFTAPLKKFGLFWCNLDWSFIFIRPLFYFITSTQIIIVFTFLDYVLVAFVTIWRIPIFQDVKQRVLLLVHMMFTFPLHVLFPALRSITSSIDIFFGMHGKC